MEQQRKNNLVGNNIIRIHQDTMRLKGLGFSQGGLNKKKKNALQQCVEGIALTC